MRQIIDIYFASVTEIVNLSTPSFLIVLFVTLIALFFSIQKCIQMWKELLEVIQQKN